MGEVVEGIMCFVCVLLTMYRDILNDGRMFMERVSAFLNFPISVLQT